jgi:secreted PhoX family phosphatase
MRRKLQVILLSSIPSLMLGLGCSHDGVEDVVESVGDVAFNLTLDDGTKLTNIDWSLRRDGKVIRSGSSPVRDDGTATALIAGVPVGSGYAVKMSGALDKGKGSCSGASPSFSVRAGKTAMVQIALQCEQTTAGQGNVNLDGEVNFCPTRPSITASASTTSVNGDAVSLNGYASDPQGDALTYSWTASSGKFDDANTPATSYRCTVTGEATLTLTADDGRGCTKSTSLTVACSPDCTSAPTSDYRTPCQPASDQVVLGEGLKAEYATREIANNADQYVFWPHASKEPTHLIFCIESSREVLADGRLQPSVQSLDLKTNEIKTVVRGMVGCDGIRTTPWGTVLATEEFADDNGGLYELMFTPESSEEYSVGERGANGEPAVVVDSKGNDATTVVVKRVATPSMAWEGLLVLDSGVIIGGDEERPGSVAADADGGAIFKFVPSQLRTGTGPIASLSDSPLVSGSVWALQASCVNNRQQAGQGCEIGNAGWVSVSAKAARPDADKNGATGYYRPEDLEMDPHFAGPGVRFCFANTGNAGADNYGEILCAVDSKPSEASDARTVVVNRLVEGDTQMNQPDNVAFHPTVPGLVYVIEDNANGDVWACLPDGDDRDIKSDGCVRMISLRDRTAEPTGFIFAPDGLSAYLAVQHSRDRNMLAVDGYATDDLLRITGFGIPDASAIRGFGDRTASDLALGAKALFGVEGPLSSSASTSVTRASTFEGGVAPTPENNGKGGSALGTMDVAASLDATYLSRVVANNADQFEFWPHASSNPTHLIFCIEGSRELIAEGKYNPSVQAIDIVTGDVKTIVRGLVGCDGLRVSPWGTILATEEFADDNGALYEILWSSESSEQYTITERGANGEPASVVDSSGNSAIDRVVKRTALPSMAWEGMLVTASGVVIGGDEERPGSVAQDADGGAIFKFVPDTLRTGTGPIASLSESPLVAGQNYALQVSCINNGQQFGQGCEIGRGAWRPVAAATARPDADKVGATGYYRPEDLHADPNYTGPGIRFCVANTGNASAANYGEVLCAIDTNPNVGSSTTGTVSINRFIEGDTQLNQPDNLEFQVGSGIVYVIEDNGFGDIWACLPDGGDRDIKSDGCVRVVSLRDSSAEPTGFMFHPDGTKAYVVVQHSADPSEAKVDDYATDDLIVIEGFASVPSSVAMSFGLGVSTRLSEESRALFGFGTPLAASATQ